MIVENYRPDVKHRLGIDYEAIQAINPRLVYGSISGFAARTGRMWTAPAWTPLSKGWAAICW